MSISIILPTYNEEENLKFLIPQLVSELEKIEIVDYEILVIDDNSTDKTVDIVKEFEGKNKKIKLYLRSSKASLPLSIYDGIQNSTKKNVMWLDADGSMDAVTAVKLINTQQANNSSVVIGSRFVEGGGYKGQVEYNENSKSVYKNLNKTEDSIYAVFLSVQFNKILKFLLNSKIKDMTSGFIVGPRDYFFREMFENAVYGEYFINVIMDLQNNDVDLIEIGYYCKPRMYGKSKTSGSILNLLSLSIPYISTAFKSRRRK